MVIQDQTQDPIRRVESIQVLEQSDEFAAAMPPLDPGGYVTGVQIQGRQDGAGPETFLFVVAAPAGMPTRYWFQIGRGVSDGLDAGFFIHRDGDDRNDPALLILQRNFLIHQQNLAHLGFQIGVAPFQVIRDLFRMQRSFGQDSVNRGFGRARQRTISRLAGMLAHMPGQRASAPDFRGIPQLLRLATGQMNHPGLGIFADRGFLGSVIRSFQPAGDPTARAFPTHFPTLLRVMPTARAISAMVSPE